MGKFWKRGFLSGVTGQYIDLDFKFLKYRGHIHFVYGNVPVCTKTHVPMSEEELAELRVN